MAATKDKPAAKKKTTRKKKGDSELSKSFDILSSQGTIAKAAVTESLRRMAERRKLKPTSFRTLSDIQQDIVPVDHFYLQYLLDCVGYPLGGFIQIIGDSRLGKSTFGHYLLGCAMRHRRCPTLAIHWAVKPFLPDRAYRTMSSDPRQAQLMVERTDQSAVATLAEMEQACYDWVQVWRQDLKLPLSIPLVILVDNASKYLSNEEAAGFVEWSDWQSAKQKKKLKETGGGSNFTSAKFFQAWTRRCGDWCPKNNVTIIAVCDQNDDIDMSQGGGVVMAEKHATLYNDTVRGGRGMKQVSILRLIFGYDSQQKVGDRLTGINVNFRCAKSSYGADERRIRGELRNDHSRYDRPGVYLDPAWHFDRDMSKWFADEGFLGTTANQGRYSSDLIGVTSSAPEQFSIAFHQNPELVKQLGSQLRIQGHFDVVGEVLRAEKESDEAE